METTGHYRIHKIIGSGTFGDTFLAEDITSREIAAVKVLRETTRTQIFLLDANTLRRLKHPYILPILEINKEARPPYIVTAYAPGGTLRRLLDRSREKLLPLQEALLLLTQLGEALHYLHVQHIIHCGLQPDCVFFDAHRTVQLGGLDLAMFEHQAALRKTSWGTALYRAPEQARGVTTPRSDQYALGCITYELLTGQHIFNQAGASSGSFELQPLRALNPALPTHVEQAVLKALAAEPEQRHSDVQAFIAALTTQPLAGGAPAEAAPAAPVALAVEIFYSCARDSLEDQELCTRLMKQLRPLERAGLIANWHSHSAAAGAAWKKERNRHLDAARIVLLLISPDFMDSDECYKIEMTRALERGNAGEAVVVPILLRPVPWRQAPFADFQVLPRNERPVTTWRDQDEALREIAEEIQRLVEERRMR